jgi:hypothetical protein
MAKLVFLGGTAAKNKWRDNFIANLVARGVAEEQLFNPVVADWNDEARRREEEAKANASHHVYYLADPQQDGNPISAYSLVEATVALYDRPKSTVVVFDTAGMQGHALKAMKQTEAVLRARHPKANIFSNPNDAVVWLANELTRGLFRIKKLFAA